MSAPPGVPSADPPESPEGAEGVAAAGSLQRARWIAGVYGVAAGVAYGALTGWRRGLALTLAAAVSIVALRSLEGVIRRLRVDAEGLPGVPAAPPGLGWRYPLRIFLLTILIVTVALVAHDPLGLVLGLSAVPLAIIVEAGLQLSGIARER